MLERHDEHKKFMHDVYELIEFHRESQKITYGDIILALETIKFDLFDEAKKLAEAEEDEQFPL